MSDVKIAEQFSAKQQDSVEDIIDKELDLAFMELPDSDGISKIRLRAIHDRKAAIKAYLSSHRKQDSWGPVTHAKIMSVQIPYAFLSCHTKQPFQVLGTLEHNDIENCFFVKAIEPGISGKNLPIVDVEKNFLRFVRKYAGCKAVFDFHIEQINRQQIVTEIRQLSLPGDSLFDCDEFDDLQMQEILQRCQHIIHNTPTSDVQTAVFSKVEDLSRLFSICQDSYPPQVCTWAENQFSQLKQGLCGSEDRRHILRSLSDVLRLNWERPNLSVPSSNEIQRRFRERFFGMDYVLQEIQEICACIRANGAFPRRPILLSGAPGTGKTDVLSFFAELLHLPLIRIDVARLLDADSILGTSRIYANARSGELWNGIVAAGAVCALVVLEEADKECGKKDAHTQPIDAFLNILEGNTFYEEFLELSIPTEGLFFAATANDTSTLSNPLVSRFRKIDIPAYSNAEKREILYRHILPEAASAVSVAPEEVSFSPEAERALLCEYGVEPGVRELKSYIEKVFRNYVYRKTEEHISCTTYTDADIRTMLGPPPTLSRNLMQLPGCVFTAVFDAQRASIIPIQASAHSGKGNLVILNATGDHQQNQVKIAYAFVRKLFPDEMENVDMTVSLMIETHDKSINDIGCAVAIAMLAALRNVSFTEKEIFLGGCDLFGTTFLDHSTIDSVISCLPESVTTIYAPTGTNRLLYYAHPDAKVGIVEMPNVLSLFQVISGRSKI